MARDSITETRDLVVALLPKLNQISAEHDEFKAEITRLLAENAENTGLKAENADLRAQIATMQAPPQEERAINYYINIAPRLRQGESISVKYDGRTYSAIHDNRYIIAPNGMRFNHPGGWSKTIYDALRARGQTALRRHKADLKAFYVKRNGILTKLTDLIE